MSDSLRMIRAAIHCPADAVRWACVLEATAPKVGNVYPGMPFADLCYRDFVVAAEIAAESFAATHLPISERVLRAVSRTVAETKTNVNLGILLLLAPLVGADEKMGSHARGIGQWQVWRRSVADGLAAIDAEDGERIFRAIAESNAGGLGSVSEMDVQASHRGGVDLLRAMRLAANHDRVARQYASQFVDLIDQVVPIVLDSILGTRDLLAGIATAHLRLLAAEPDTLIARKRGWEVAVAVQNVASGVSPQDPTAVTDLDTLLRRDGNQLNPGTTADLIAAALYLLLRTQPSAYREIIR